MPRTLAVCIALLALALSCLDDFEADALDRWQTSVSPEYYRGGEGNEGLAIVDDPEQGRVMRATIAFMDERKSEPVWITRFVDKPFPIARVISVSFRYKISGTDEPPIDSFKLRLRTSPRAFTDHEVLAEDGVRLDRWTQVTVPVREGLSKVNIYRYIFGEVQQVTLRLDDIDERNSQFDLLVDDIRVITDQPRVISYEPAELSLRRDDRLDVLLIRHSAAGYYDVEEAARALDPSARVSTYLFRGLHFPLWGFPETLDELLGYDVIVMVDVDPWVLTAEQATWLADLVHSGAGLVFFGGPNTLTHAQEFKLPLAEALPVTFEPGAKDVGGGTPVAHEHPLSAGLPVQRLGTVGPMQPLALRDGALAAFSVGDQPLVACGEFGAGRVAVVNARPSYAEPMRERFLTGDLSDDLMRSLLRWASQREPGARLTTVEPPPRSVVAPAQVTVAAAAEGASRIRLAVEGLAEQLATAEGRVEFTLDLPEPVTSDRRFACRVEALDAAGEVTDRRDFELEALSPVGVDVAWAAHQYTFAPGGPVEFEVRPSRRGLPVLTPHGTSLGVSFASGALPVTASALADLWVFPPGSEEILHSQASVDVLETTETREDMLPRVITTGITRADRPDMTFGDDDRIQRVQRVAEVLADGSVRVTSRYEFLQDVRISRITTMISLPASVYAGLPFVAEQGGERIEGELPETEGRRILDGTGLALTIETPHGPLSIEVLDPSLHVWMQDLRRYGSDNLRIEMESPFENGQAHAGDTYEVPVLITGPAEALAPVPPAEDLSVRCELRDPDGETVMSWPARPATADLTFADELPDLRSGEYEMVASVLSRDETVAKTAAPCWVVDPLEREDFFPIMTVLGERGGGHEMDEAQALARVDDIMAHGLNAITAGNARSLSGPTMSHGSAISTAAASYAQRRGLATFFEYHRLTLIRRDGPTEPPVFDPEHRERLREYIEPQLDVCRRVPRLLSIKIIDEPHMRAEHLNCGERCREAFEARYGAEYAPVDELGEDVAARWRLADFLGEYVRRSYQMTREIKEEGGGDYDLLLTFNSPGLGYGRGHTSRQDVLSWGAETGRMDFDIYPYFYPRSQKVRMVQCDYGLSMMREFAREIGIPWGFYVELDERNWPYQQNPKEASAECAWTAIAHGADYLNTFIHSGFGTGNDARPERWEEAGRALRTIRRAGPLLTRMSRPKAPLAMIYPMGQAMVNDGHAPADYALECIRGGFGMADVVSSEIIAGDEATLERDCYVLLGCEILERVVAQKLRAFWRGGGTVVLDRVPTTDTEGEPLELPWDFEGAQPRTLPRLDDCTYRLIEAADGGSVIRLDFDLNEAYREAVEGDDFERAAALRRGVAGLLRGGDASSCFADDAHGQMEAGLRTCDDAAMVVAVNHLPDENEATLRLSSIGLEPTWACDLETMEPVALTATAAGCTIPVSLPARHARMIALLPERPADVEVNIVRTDPLRPGDELRYRARVLTQEGTVARGCHLLEIEVTGPDGEVVSRFGGSTATEAGVATRSVTVPVNALAGEYRIVAQAPQAAATDEATFRVIR